uniref:LINE-1 type transposase domain-containing protein 1 n=1 Tax=Dicentrarchus labrax TaxID=13489 RepID=A0A8C4GET5_DICLA
MASKTQRKSTKAAAQSLASPSLKRTLMANANASATTTHHPGLPSSPEIPEENALVQLLKAEMESSHRQLADIIKQEMVTFCAEIKQDLEALRQDTKADIASLKSELRAEMASMHSTQTETETTVREIEGALNCHDSSITSMESVVLELKREIGKLKDRNDDLENRSRRQNLRIIGIPESAENGKPTEIPSPLVLDRAHRTLAILQLSRNKGELKFREARIHIFPDMSAEFSRRRAAFNLVKAKLRQAGIKYGMFHPADLRLTCDGVSHSFKEPADKRAAIFSWSLILGLARYRTGMFICFHLDIQLTSSYPRF